MKNTCVKTLLLGVSFALFVLMSLSPQPLSATTAEEAYNQGKAAGIAAGTPPEGSQTEEDDNGCCGGLSMST